jgi:hypothetical protein
MMSTIKGFAAKSNFLGGNSTSVLESFDTLKAGNVNQFPGDGRIHLKISGFVDGCIRDQNNAGNRINQQRLPFDPEFEVQDVPGSLPILWSRSLRCFC